MKRKKKETRGGFRSGSGRKPKDDEPRKTISFLVSMECKDFIEALAKDQGVSRSDVLNELIRQAMAKE